MTGLLNNAGIHIPCAECGKRTQKPIQWIQEHAQLACSCGNSIDLDQSQETKAIRRLKKALKRLDNHPFA